VAQLINKTNQFNLTTIRRSEAEIRSLSADPDWDVWSMQVQDNYGDYGIVGVAIIDRTKDPVHLDTLLMSCRVLARGVETALLSVVTADVTADSANTLTAAYEPTRKNGQVETLYTEHGFSQTGPGLFELPAGAAIACPAHIELVVPDSPC
jgi:FkbH-like protein